MHIKLLTTRLSVLLALCALITMSSCKKDDDVTIPVVTGINVGDGFYMAKKDADPLASDQLVAETVEDADFGSQERAGFLANYLYLTAGDYNMVQITSKAVTATFGGTATTVTDTGSGCDYNDYTVVDVAADGAAVTVAAGFYKVTYDALTSEMVLYKIEAGGIIGSATPGGWGSDTPIPGTISATGGSWEATELTLRKGEFKIRFNCRWNLDRRIDPAAGFAAANGYQLFTNFGGSVTNLETGNDGANIPVTEEEEGVYTVKIDWLPTSGFNVTLTKTGDVAPITFVPDENQWAVIGDATNSNDDDMDGTPDGWQTDTDMNYEGFDAGTNTYTWKATNIALEGDKAFKFRTNDSWDNNIGWGQVELMGDTADFSDDGGNIKVANTASYDIILTTSDDGDNYRASFTKL